LLALASTLQQEETLFTFESTPQQALEVVSLLLAVASFTSGPQQLP
jgi:hypothetical protein